MAQFMEGGTVPIDRFEIRARRRHLHKVTRDIIISARTADAEIRPSCGDQGLGPRLDLARRWRNDRSRDLLGQAVALVGIEDGEAFEERNRARLLPGLRGAAAFVLWCKTIGIDHGGAALALPDMAAKSQRLAEGQPALPGKPALDHGTPQDQHVDSGISALRRGVARHRQRRLHGRGAPRLHPRHPPRFQLSDDLVGDFGVKVRPVVAGTRM